jgi:integrase
MPIRFIPPGERKGNRFYIARGTLDDLGEVEISTKETDLRRAKEAFKLIVADLRDRRVPGPSEEVTFRQAARHYLAYRNLLPNHFDAKKVNALAGYKPLGDKPVAQVIGADLHDAARALYPGQLEASWNRSAVGPGAWVLHYAADQKWCPWLRVKMFKVPKPKTRSVAPEAAMLLLANVPASRRRGYATAWHRRLLLLWLFKQGDRISDALKVEWDWLDLGRRVISGQTIGKADGEERDTALDDEVWEMLANTPNEIRRKGYLFPWRTRAGVYRWLQPMVTDLGVRFTPHMARHSVGKWFKDQGASLKTIMEKLHHKDAKSALRYQASDVEVVRAVGRKVGRLTQ